MNPYKIEYNLLKLKRQLLTTTDIEQLEEHTLETMSYIYDTDCLRKEFEKKVENFLAEYKNQNRKDVIKQVYIKIQQTNTSIIKNGIIKYSDNNATYTNFDNKEIFNIFENPNLYFFPSTYFAKNNEKPFKVQEDIRHFYKYIDPRFSLNIMQHIDVKSEKFPNANFSEIVYYDDVAFYICSKSHLNPFHKKGTIGFDEAFIASALCEVIAELSKLQFVDESAKQEDEKLPRKNNFLSEACLSMLDDIRRIPSDKRNGIKTLTDLLTFLYPHKEDTKNDESKAAQICKKLGYLIPEVYTNAGPARKLFIIVENFPFVY